MWHLLKRPYVKGMVTLLLMLVVATLLSSNIGVKEVQGMSLEESDWSTPSLEEQEKTYVDVGYKYPSQQVLATSYKVAALCLLISLGTLITSFLLCAKDGSLKVYTLAGKCSTITFIWMIFLGFIFGRILKEVPLRLEVILINTIYLLCMNREFKQLKNEITWKKIMIAGMGSGAIFIILMYCVMLCVRSLVREVLQFSIATYDYPSVMNNSLIHNVKVQTAADFYILLFEAIWLMIMITAVIVLLGTFIKQEKEGVGLVSSIGVVAVISIAIELLGGKGYPVYCLLGVAGVACIIVTYHLQNRKKGNIVF